MTRGVDNKLGTNLVSRDLSVGRKAPENEFGSEASGNTTMKRSLGLQGHSKPTNVMRSFSDYRTAIGLVQ